MSSDRTITSYLERLLQIRRGYKRLLVIAVDAVLCVMAVQLSLSLRLGEWIVLDRPSLIITLIALALWAPIYIGFGTYRTIFRFVGSGTMMALARVTAFYTVPIAAICMLWQIPGVPRTIGLIFPILFFVLLCFSRIFLRYIVMDVLNQKYYVGEPRRMLIYGAGSSGKQLASSLRHEPGVQLLGFVDDDRRLDSQALDSLRVHHSSKLARLIERYQITDIVLAMPSNAKSRNRDIVEGLERFAVHVRTLPSIGQLVSGQITSQDLREIDVEDLLGRDPVAPIPNLLTKNILGKTVMVTGAGGSIGSELCRQILSQRPRVLVLVEMTEFALYHIEQNLVELRAKLGLNDVTEIKPVLVNVTDRRQVGRLLDLHRPDTVFHAAAYKHVPLLEQNALVGLHNNVFGTLAMALESERCGVSNFVLVSTDKAVRPTNVMGATKRICELILQARAAQGGQTCMAMVRFGNVLGSSGSVVPRFEKQIREGGPVTLTHRDVTRYFMTIPEASQLVIQAGAMAEGGEVFVLDMGNPVKIYDLARAMIRLSGFTVRTEASPEGEIEIREVGLRPGEKLYEELLIGDSASLTVHSRIMQAKERFVPWDVLDKSLAELTHALNTDDLPALMRVLRRLVPEYQPNPGSSDGTVPPPEQPELLDDGNHVIFIEEPAKRATV